MFDRFVVVDWSANSTPKRGRDSIWIASKRGDDVAVSNPPTRRQAEQQLIHDLEHEPGTRTLLGVDFSLGYPTGTSAGLGLSGVPWVAMADHLAEVTTDGPRNRNNRFEVASALNRRLSRGPAPFWGCPPAHASATLASKKSPSGVLAEWRMVETALRTQGHRPFSSWQLLGAGSVGSQSLLGIPMIVRLRERLGARLDVWPFTTGVRPPLVTAGTVVVAEIWPSLFTVVVPDGVVRDAAQVCAVADRLASLDAAGELEAWFTPRVPADQLLAVECEEGWVLGVMP